ncbi:MAG: redoxin domain-containing protein [Anaerolineae bacterium]|nr:redoxin domain-containing protein [Anaerolineae bacterium]
MRWMIRVSVLALLLLAVTGALWAQEATPAADAEQTLYEGQVDAPPFPPGLDWLNVPAPLTLDGLRGKIILLDFWTYGCINCLHMIPVLQSLAETYARELVILSVHSAKFDNEGQTANLRQIVQRYAIQHPVINDRDLTVWRTYGIRAWPTFVVIDPRGRVVALQSGEISLEAFERYIGGMVAYYDRLGQGDLNREPLAAALEGAGDPGTLLLFPGKVQVDAAGQRLFIADSSHHRIIIADLTTYEVLAVIGSGQRGRADGPYADAQFNQPQGLALRGETLVVADTGNHLLRAVDLATQTVTTLAGTGRMGRTFVPFDLVMNAPLQVDLRSPWDVAFDADGTLYIAMAGTHQLWRLDATTGALRVLVGSGREAQNNGSLRTTDLAQPSGLYYHAGRLYFADAESSTVRVADLAGDAVQVIAGTTANDLFDYGDVDGPPGRSRLQHPLAVVGTGTDDGPLYIADSYNSKIKVYDPAAGTTTTLSGTGGTGGFRDGAADVAQFDEPGGLAYAAGRLYVADTSNHAIRVIDLATGQVSTVTFPNPAALQRPEQPVTLIGGNAAGGEEQTLAAQTVAAGAGQLHLTLELPDGYKLNPLVASTLVLESTPLLTALPPATATAPVIRYVITGDTLTVPVTFQAGTGTLTADLTLFYCEAVQESFCFIDEVRLRLPVTVATTGAEADTLRLERRVIPPDL